MPSYSKDTIKTLVAEGRLEDALVILSEVSTEGVPLSVRFSRLNRVKLLGTVSTDEYFIERRNIEAAILDIIARIGHDNRNEYNGTKITIESNVLSEGKSKYGWVNPWAKERTANKREITPSIPRIYILAHLKDLREAETIKEHLELAGFTYIIDHTDAQIGEKLGDFANHNLLDPEFVIVLVSRSSLKYGWGGLERYTDLVSNALIHPHCMALTLDRDYEKPNFIADFSEQIEDELEDLYKKKSNSLISQKILALNNQRNHLARIVQRLRQTEPIDYSLEHIKKMVGQIKSIVESKAAKSKTFMPHVPLHSE